MRALLYARVSKDRKQSRSVEEQIAECRAVADREGWEIVDVLSDNGRSASRYAKKGRPAWVEVKSQLATGTIDVLVTWEASRSGRDLAQFVEVRDIMRANGVLFSYSGHTLDLNDTHDSFRAGLDALLGENESNQTRDRILRAVRGQAEKGRPHGRKLYGYKRVYDEATGALVGQVPDDDEAGIVREVARRFLSGDSLYAITDDLNARGVSDRPWNSTRVKRLLLNPGYVGKRVHRGEVVGDADWEPLIDGATFDAIGERLERPGARGGHDVKHLLSGWAKCGRCGGAMYVGKAGGKLTYECAPGRGHVARNQEHLDAYVTAVILERLATIDFSDLHAENPDAVEARAEAAEMRQRLDGAADKYAAGEISPSMLAKVEANLTPKIKAAEKRARAAAVPPNLDALAGEGVDARWDALTIEQRREVVRVLVHVTVLPTTKPKGTRGFDPDAVKLEWRV
jgi:DNA invertase Pin-like site-specific DNA recombinase